MKTGGAKEDRTPDLLNAIQALSQLSYNPLNHLQNNKSFIKSQAQNYKIKPVQINILWV